MINNEENSTVKVPDEVQSQIESYKNQLTNSGLEVSRLNRLKAQTEIAISSLGASVVAKQGEVTSLNTKIEKLEKSKKELKEENSTLKESNVKLTKENTDTKKDTSERLEVASLSEGKLKKGQEKLVEDQDNLKDSSVKLDKDKKELKRKEDLIKEFSAKL